MTGAVLEEGLRGAGAHLRNADGERYMERYDPERLERSTRDVVSRSSYLEIMAGRGSEAGGVFIDISHLGAAEVERRFPGMVARTRQIGSDLATGPVEVSPTAHFHMGGVLVTPDCRTELEGLLVAGEDAGGVHGANRLGGNGVAESTVFGARAGDTAAALAPDRGWRPIDPTAVARVVAEATAVVTDPGRTDPFLLTDEVKDAMWTGCGVVRDAAGLDEAAARLDGVRARLGSAGVPADRRFNRAWQEYLDVRNQVTVARSVVLGAQVRRETRGAHARADFPDRDDTSWLRQVVQRQAADGSLTLELRPVDLSRLAPEGVAS